MKLCRIEDNQRDHDVIPARGSVAMVLSRGVYLVHFTDFELFL